MDASRHYFGCTEHGHWNTLGDAHHCTFSLFYTLIIPFEGTLTTPLHFIAQFGYVVCEHLWPFRTLHFTESAVKHLVQIPYRPWGIGHLL